MELLSVVVPCYNEEEAVPIFYRETLKAIEPFKNELDIEFVSWMTEVKTVH